MTDNELTDDEITGGTFNGLGLKVKRDTTTIHPLNNHCLIEVLDDYEGVIRNTENENMQKGKLLGCHFVPFHLTASTGFDLSQYTMSEVRDDVEKSLGKTVYWQEYADAGSKFTVDGKKYVLVPFYRLIGFEG